MGPIKIIRVHEARPDDVHVLRVIRVGKGAVIYQAGQNGSRHRGLQPSGGDIRRLRNLGPRGLEVGELERRNLVQLPAAVEQHSIVLGRIPGREGRHGRAAAKVERSEPMSRNEKERQLLRPDAQVVVHVGNHAFDMMLRGFDGRIRGAEPELLIGVEPEVTGNVENLAEAQLPGAGPRRATGQWSGPTTWPIPNAATGPPLEKP